jgi:hypothetical protein
VQITSHVYADIIQRHDFSAYHGCADLLITDLDEEVPGRAAADSAFHAAIGSGEQSTVTAVCLFALLRGCNRSCP